MCHEVHPHGAPGWQMVCNVRRLSALWAFLTGCIAARDLFHATVGRVPRQFQAASVRYVVLPSLVQGTRQIEVMRSFGTIDNTGMSRSVRACCREPRENGGRWLLQGSGAVATAFKLTPEPGAHRQARARGFLALRVWRHATDSQPGHLKGAASSSSARTLSPIYRSPKRRHLMRADRAASQAAPCIWHAAS